MAQQYDVTSVGLNPAEDRAHRMKMYLIAMSIRVFCVVSLVWVRGWWILVAAVGAVVLPYIAVMLGNAVSHGGQSVATPPSPLQLENSSTKESQSEEKTSEQTLIVVDHPLNTKREHSGTDATEMTSDDF